MARTAKITAARLPIRKTAAGASAMRRAFPAWIDADGPRVALPSATPFVVAPRVRAELFLRSVPLTKVKRLPSSSDVRGGR
jgi:hypothetical protein